MYEDVCYERSFLKQVIARIDFLAPNETLRQSMPAKLANEVAKLFPISEPKQSIAEELQIGPDELHRRQKRQTDWHFYGKEREKRLTITADAAFVSYSSYTTYDDLKAEFLQVVQALWQAFPDTRATRSGLRYVNNVEIPDNDPTDWTHSFADGLLGVLNFLKEPDYLTRAFHIYEYKYGDIHLRYQFGMPNPDFPAPIKRPLFVLDLDARTDGPLDIGEIANALDRSHEKIQSLFEKSITDDLRERMGAKHQQPA